MLNRVKTTSLTASVLLAMTTSAFALALPPGGITVTGDVSLEESAETDVFLSNPSVYSGFPHDIFRISVTNATEFLLQINAANFDSSNPTNMFAVLYSGDKAFLPNTPVPWDVVLAGDPSDVLDFTGFSEGEYTLVVGSNFSALSDGVGTYSFTLFGATFLDLLAALDVLAGEQATVAANHIAQALSASIFNAVKSGLTAGTPIVSREAAGLNTTEGNRTWFQMDYTVIDGTDLDGRFPTMQAGIDFQLENGMIVGAALGYSDFSISSAASDLDGTSLSIQPYLGFRSGEVTGAVTLSFGKLDLETTDGAGTAEGDMRALSLSLERPFALGGHQVIALFDGGFGRQEIDSATGSLAGMADTYSTWSFASLGARYEMQAGAALMSFGASVDYNDVGNLDNIAADHYGSDGFTGAVNFGLDYQMGSGSNLYVNAEIGGIGGDALRKSVQAGIDFRF